MSRTTLCKKSPATSLFEENGPENNEKSDIGEKGTKTEQVEQIKDANKLILSKTTSASDECDVELRYSNSKGQIGNTLNWAVFIS